MKDTDLFLPSFYKADTQNLLLHYITATLTLNILSKTSLKVPHHLTLTQLLCNHQKVTTF